VPLASVPAATSETQQFEHVLVLGLGIIGGSFCKALRRSGVAKQISAFSLQEDATLALQSGAVDYALTAVNDLAPALQRADLVVLALPVPASIEMMPLLSKHLLPNAVLTDTCSVKAAISKAAKEALGTRFHQYVGGHPIAGSHLSGFGGAQVDLFTNAQVILDSDSARTEAQKVAALWRTLGAQVQWMSAIAHDELYAHVSHLPHLAAFALMNAIAAYSKANAEIDLPSLVGKGFLDTTRVAASSAQLWTEICLENRQPLITSLDAFINELGNLRAMLTEADVPGLKAALLSASEARNSF
jgi:prephenate dehydrogenase